MKSSLKLISMWSGLLSCVVCLQTVDAQVQYFSDFNDGSPDWDLIAPKPFEQSFVEENGQLTISATFPPTDGIIVNSLSAATWSVDHALRDGETLEYRVNLVSTSSDDVMAGLIFYAAGSTGEGQYALLISGNEVNLTKVNWNTGTVAAFIRETVTTKHENVILSLMLTRVGDSLLITCRILDAENGNAVLYEKAVSDTSAIDPTVSSWPGLTHLTPDENGLPYGFNGSDGASLILAQVTDGTKPEAQVVYDNFTRHYRTYRGPYLLSDFNDGIPDWVAGGIAPLVATETGGQLSLKAVWPSTQGNLANSVGGVGWPITHPTSDGETVEYRVDLVRASDPSIFAHMQIDASNKPGEGAYAYLKNSNEISLTKIRFEQGFGLVVVAVLFRDEIQTKHEGVTLSASLTRVGSTLFFTYRVLDTENDGAVLYERTVRDSPAIDPTVSDWPGLNNLTLDEAGTPYGVQGFQNIAGFNGIWLGQARVTDGNDPEGEIIYDNLIREIHGPRVSNVQRVDLPNDQLGVKLSWLPFSSPIVVEGSPSVDGPWSQVTEPTVDANGMKEITIPFSPSNPLRIFRLKK